MERRSGLSKHSARELPPRPSKLKWRSQWHFEMGLICWTAGLANCWKFPVTMSLSCGWMILVPYLIETVFIGVPVSCMELGLGQFASKGPIGVWALCPLFKGIGYANVVLLLFVILYYNVINGYFIFFIFASMATAVPWSKCDPAWAGVNCFTFQNNSSIKQSCVQEHGGDYCKALRWENSATHFWRKRVLNAADADSFLGKMQVHLLICSAVNAMMVFALTFQGVKSFARFAWFLTLFPYVDLVLLLVASLTDPGSVRGLKVFLTNDYTNLLTITSWRVPLQQILFSVGLGLGGLTTLGSQHSFRNPVHAQAIAINLIDMATAFCYTILIFNCLGTISFYYNIPIEEVVGWKDALLFSKLPLAFLSLPGLPQLWGVFFFSGVYSLGLRCQALMMSTVLCAAYEYYPKTLQHTILSAAVGAVAVVLMGYPYLTQIGTRLIAYMDLAASGPALCILNFMQLVAISYIYGVNHFTDDLHFMLGFRCSYYWQVPWLLAPLVVLLALVDSNRDFFTSSRRPDGWVLVAQCLVFGLPILLVLAGMAHRFWQKNENPSLSLLRPEPSWGPADPILRKSREMFTAHAMTKEYLYRQTRLKEKLDMQEQEDYETA